MCAFEKNVHMYVISSNLLSVNYQKYYLFKIKIRNKLYVNNKH